MEAIYAHVDKTIYRYGRPIEDQKSDQVKPHEALFANSNSFFNLKNIDVVDEKEDYDNDDDDDDEMDAEEYDDNNYNDKNDDDDDENDDDVDEHDDDNNDKPMEIDNIDFLN
ncbi:trigger factor-like [Hydra vulgaris]|uniref:trigger factor-like n=1 Tax=Hydra vulgaris TaxID=6087 RepID=UPI0032EA2F31